MEQVLKEILNAIKGLKTDVTEIKADVTELKTDVAGLKADVTELKTDVAGLKADVTELKADVAGLKTDVTGLKADVIRLNTDVAGFQEGQKQLFAGQASIIQRLDKLDSRVDNLEGQTRENTDMIKVLLHRTEEVDAKFDGLLHTTATKESIANLATREDMSAQFRVLNERLFRQEVEVDKLKAVR